MPPSPTPPVTVTFRAFCPGLEIDKIRQVMWLVDTTRVAINPPPGLAFTWTFTDPERTYDIQARVYATDGELFGLTSFETGSVGLGPMGTWRNRFEARGAPANLDVCGAWWRGGDGTWSACAPFGGGRIGAVDAYLLHTGEQTEGWNAGFLVAAVAGRPGLRTRSTGSTSRRGPVPCTTKDGSTPTTRPFARRRSRSRRCIRARLSCNGLPRTAPCARLGSGRRGRSRLRL